MLDALRFLGAICIVWYHNPYYWSLADVTSVVDNWKFVLLGWSMPFFYAASFYFAFRQVRRSSAIARVGRLLLLIVVYTLMYAAVTVSAPTGLFQTCVAGRGSCDPVFLLSTFRNVSDTPLYYLSDLTVIVVLAILCSWLPRSLQVAVPLAVAVILWIAGEYRGFGLFLNPLAIGCFVVALMSIIIEQRWKFAGLVASPVMWVAGVLAFIGGWGLLNWALVENAYWRAGPLASFVFGVLLLLPLTLGMRVRPTGALIDALSRWGQRLSFGIFAFHQLSFDVIGSLLRIIHDPLLSYLAAGVVATGMSILATLLCRRLAPILLKA